MAHEPEPNELSTSSLGLLQELEAEDHRVSIDFSRANAQEGHASNLLLGTILDD